MNCEGCGQHLAVVNEGGRLLCGTCAVEAHMLIGGERVGYRADQYKKHAQREDVIVVDFAFTMPHCDCPDCVSFRVNMPSVAAKIEADVYFRARRALLVMQSTTKKESNRA